MLAHILALLAALPEYRAPQVDHPLGGTLSALFLSKIAGCGGWDASADWIAAQHAKLCGKLELFVVPPSADTLRRLSEHFGLCAFFGGLRLSGGVLHIDGKRARGAKADGRVHHFIEALMDGWVVAMREMEQGAEGPAVVALLRELKLEGVMVTIDAAGTTPAVAGEILARGGDFLLAVKANQPNLLAACEAAFATSKAPARTEKSVGHGRHEFRRARTITDRRVVAGVAATAKICGIHSICRIERTRILVDGIETTVQFHISSKPLSALDYLRINRSHWRIEAMHHTLDVSFGEDACRISKAAAVSGALLRHAWSVVSELRGALSCRRFSARIHADPSPVLALIP